MTLLQVESHQHRVEGEDHFPGPAAHTSLAAAQDIAGCLGKWESPWKETWLCRSNTAKDLEMNDTIQTQLALDQILIPLPLSICLPATQFPHLQTMTNYLCFIPGLLSNVTLSFRSALRSLSRSCYRNIPSALLIVNKKLKM